MAKSDGNALGLVSLSLERHNICWIGKNVIFLTVYSAGQVASARCVMVKLPKRLAGYIPQADFSVSWVMNLPYQVCSAQLDKAMLVKAASGVNL
ncbi:MAG: hypothetical protein RQ715_09860 [Methylococcales bacterium]|nr:hypothetical protein [Methylococcales bacterium]